MEQGAALATKDDYDDTTHKQLIAFAIGISILKYGKLLELLTLVSPLVPTIDRPFVLLRLLINQFDEYLPLIAAMSQNLEYDLTDQMGRMNLVYDTIRIFPMTVHPVPDPSGSGVINARITQVPQGDVSIGTN